MTKKRKPKIDEQLSAFDREQIVLMRRMKRLESVARAAGLLCVSFVFTEPRLTAGQQRLAQRIRRDVPKLLSR